MRSLTESINWRHHMMMHCSGLLRIEMIPGSKLLFFFFGIKRDRYYDVYLRSLFTPPFGLWIASFTMFIIVQQIYRNQLLIILLMFTLLVCFDYCFLHQLLFGILSTIYRLALVSSYSTYLCIITRNQP